MAVRVQREPFDVGAEIAAMGQGGSGTGSAVGGIVSFTGLVRGEVAGRRLIAMTLEHYPGMTQAELARVEAEARARWPLDGCLIVHRYGRLVPGDGIVLVVTASAHREAAFKAAEFLMDYLKTSAPFWKKEEVEGGEASWVEAKAGDDAARERWTEK